MNFNQYHDDIDVYSLCESVYYSCNNDEYDYVLECVNDWIMNGYNDTILLEDIVLNEAFSNDSVDKRIKSQFNKLFPGLDYHEASKSWYNRYSRDSDLYKFFSYTTSLINRSSAKSDINNLITKRFGPYTYSSYIRDNEGHSKLLKDLTPEELKKELDGRKRELKGSEDYDYKYSARDQYNSAFGKKGGHSLTFRHRNMLRNTSGLGSYVPSYNPNRDYDDYDDISPAPSFQSRYEQAKKNSQGRLESLRKQQEEERNNILTRYNQAREAARQRLEDKKGKPAEAVPERKVEKQQENPLQTPSNSNTPLKDKKGRTIKKLGTGFKGRKFNPVQTPPNTPPIPQQQEPPTSNTPVKDKKGRTIKKLGTGFKGRKFNPVQTPPNTPPIPQQQEPPTSNTPFKDKKGRTIKKLGTGFKGRKFNPVQTPPNTPPQQQEPPTSNTPAVTSNNNNQSRLSRATTWMKNNKGKTALGVGLGAAAIGGGIYAYKQYKNKPRSVIAKRIAALRGIYRKFMINAQRNPQKANIFKRIAAKILSVIDKLMAFMQNTADGR